MFSTQIAKRHTPNLLLNRITIALSDKVRYLGGLGDQNLRFHKHVQSVVTTVLKKRVYCEELHVS